ncbi:MAG: DUF4760 domain-containing protein [Nitrospirota bacterium]|nr:DUF4760 domain-containing protein [Nitrospirota bacterium]
MRFQQPGNIWHVPCHRSDRHGGHCSIAPPRSSNEIAALNELREGAGSERFTAALNFVVSDLEKALEDPAFRYQMTNRGARSETNRELIAKLMLVGNFFAGAGMLVRRGFVHKDLAVDSWCYVALASWQALEPVVAIFRRSTPSAVWDNFENFAMLSEDWKAAHPDETYPTGALRLELCDKWREADASYAASLSTVQQRPGQ